MAAGIAVQVLRNAAAVGAAGAQSQPIIGMTNRLTGDDCQTQLTTTVVAEDAAPALGGEAV